MVGRRIETGGHTKELFPLRYLRIVDFGRLNS
jgi:hypothetical protein